MTGTFIWLITDYYRYNYCFAIHFELCAQNTSIASAKFIMFHYHKIRVILLPFLILEMGH